MEQKHVITVFRIHDWIKNDRSVKEKNFETTFFQKWMECVIWPLCGSFLRDSDNFLRKYFLDSCERNWNEAVLDCILDTSESKSIQKRIKSEEIKF